MDDFSFDYDLKTESGDGMSIDDILSEYKLENFTAEPTPAPEYSGYSPIPEEDVRVYTPGKKREKQPEPVYKAEARPSYEAAYEPSYDAYAPDAGLDYYGDSYGSADEVGGADYAAENYGDGIDYDNYDGYDNYVDYSEGIDYNSPGGYNLGRWDGGAEQYTEASQKADSEIDSLRQEARRYVAELQQARRDEEQRERPAFDEGLDADPTIYSYEDDSAFTASPDVEPEIDSRFNLSGVRREYSMKYGSREVDQSADEQYVPKSHSEYSPSQWTPDYDDPDLGDREHDDEPGHKKRRISKRKQKKLDKQKREALSAEDAYGDADSLRQDQEQEDEDFDPSLYEEQERSIDEEEFFVPPTFREYVLSLVASVFLRIRGGNRNATADTMVDRREDLGQELKPADASKYYGSFLKSMKLRLRIAAVLELMLIYISLQLPLPGMLKALPVSAAACFALQSGILLLCLDIFTNGILNIFYRRFAADGLAVICCLLSGADAMMVALSGPTAAHMPLCAASSLSFIGLLLASYFNVKSLRKATRVPAIGKQFYTVTGEVGENGRELSLLKSRRAVEGFVRRAEEEPPDETLSRRLSPILLLLSILMATAVALLKGCAEELIFILSAFLVPCVPICAFSAFALPFMLGSNRVFRVGGAIAGWSGLCDLGAGKNLIVTDRDLFPEEYVTMENVRIFADGDAHDVISYAGSLVSASGACSAGCFKNLMEENDCGERPIENFEYLPGGGVRGNIEGHEVLCGSTDLMRLNNVRIPFRLTDKTSVLLAIDGILYGIFSLHYEPHPAIRQALVELVRSNRHPVFAIRDFNINPELLHNTYDIATDGYDFPPYAERFKLTESSAKKSRIAALVCNEGLGPLTEVADVGKRMHSAIKANIILTALSSVLGVLAVLLRILTVGSMGVKFLLCFMLITALPIPFVSLYVNTR